MASQKVNRHNGQSRASSLPAAVLLDLPDEVLMRIMCGVHAADEHWMHHLSSVARLATVCHRLRACADEVYAPAGPRAAARAHLVRLGAVASQLPRVEEFSVAGLRLCIEEGKEVVSRYETLARAVGMADAAWHRQHVRISTMAFLDASAWLDRFVAHSQSLAKCVADTTAQLSGQAPTDANASGASPPAAASPLQHNEAAAAAATTGPASRPSSSAAALPAAAAAAASASAAAASSIGRAGGAVQQGGVPAHETQSDAQTRGNGGSGNGASGHGIGAHPAASPGCASGSAGACSGDAGRGSGSGSVSSSRVAQAAGSSIGGNAAGHGGRHLASETTAGGAGGRRSIFSISTRMPDVTDVMTSVCHQVMPASQHLEALHQAPPHPLLAAGQQG